MYFASPYASPEHTPTFLGQHPTFVPTVYHAFPEPQLISGEDLYDDEEHHDYNLDVVVSSYQEATAVNFASPFPDIPFYDFWHRIMSYFTTDRENVYLSAAGVKYFYDLPPVFCDSRTGLVESATAQVAVKGCHCMPGETCGRRLPSTSRYLFKRAITYQRPPLLRLRCWEAWKLRANEIGSWDSLLSKQVRYDATTLWSNPGNFEGYLSVEVEPGCRTSSYWLDLGLDSKRTPRLLYAQQEESGGFSFFLAIGTTCRVEAIVYPTNTLHWLPLGYRACHRLVEYEFVHRACVQGSTTVSPWSSQFAQDFFGQHAEPVLKDLFHARERGLLRLLFGRGH